MEQRVLGGRYLLKDKVGTGGMATVYRAQDQVLDRTVAVKIMLPQYAGDATFAARFKQEAQAAAGLSSPYIVGVYDWGKDGDTYYIVMEYLRGTDLKSGIKSHGALDPKKVAQIGSQISSALSVAHKHEIIHRDIKPQNIMVLPDGNIKVMDFGIARAKNSHLTQDNNVLGTAHYVSPEQTRGQDLGPTSDIYSLGVVMYECATGRVPFDGDDAISVALKQVNELPIPPSQINSGVDADLERIILKCMEKDPANRFQTADELRQVLNSYLSGRAVNISEPTRIIGAPGELGATKTRELSDQTRAMVRPVSGVSGQNTARSSVSGSTGSYEVEKPKSNKNKIIAAVVAAVAVIGIVVAFATGLFGGEQVPVPDVLGKDQQTAVELIKEAGLEVGTIDQSYNDDVDEGKVAEQTPNGHTKKAKGTKVNLVISKGPKPSEKVEVPRLVGLTKDQAEAAAKSETMEKLLEIQSDQYSLLTARIQDNRRARHDFRQHLAVIRDCADRGDLASLKNYLNEYENMFPIQEVRTYCKNYAVNAILSFYAEKAEKNGISMQVTIQMADPPVIPETEFCVLVGNLLENAVDACADTDAEIQSFIRLHVVQTGSSMLSITADNTSSGSPNWSGDKLLSTKHSGYGIGTESIRMIAERYSGDARFRWKDGIFYASVMLNPQV